MSPEQKRELSQLLDQIESRLQIQASKNKQIKLESSFQEFIREFWDEVPGAGSLIWNWHMEILANELQQLADRVINKLPRLHDLIVNISPGTSKSTIASILFPAWTWTRFPQARHICASHTETLVLDFGAKSRAVIQSEKYQSYWPVQFRKDQDAKGYFANSAGGDRLSCTVGGKSPMGFHAHFLTCLPGETEIQTCEGPVAIAAIVHEQLPLQVLGVNNRTSQLTYQHITSFQQTPGKPLVRIHFE